MTPAVPAGRVEEGAAAPDAVVERLARLFREHPAWIRAANRLDSSACSTVYFSHRPGEVWHLVSRDGETVLARGDVPAPDFRLRFTPAAIERLGSVEGGVGDFAVTLFELMLEVDDERGVGFRIVAPFRTLVRKGYVQLLLAGGGQLLAFAATHGVRTLSDLHRLVARLTTRKPHPWERTEGSDARSQRR